MRLLGRQPPDLCGAPRRHRSPRSSSPGFGYLIAVGLLASAVHHAHALPPASNDTTFAHEGTRPPAAAAAHGSLQLWPAGAPATAPRGIPAPGAAKPPGPHRTPPAGSSHAGRQGPDLLAPVKGVYSVLEGWLRHKAAAKMTMTNQHAPSAAAAAAAAPRRILAADDGVDARSPADDGQADNAPQAPALEASQPYAETAGAPTAIAVDTVQTDTPAYEAEPPAPASQTSTGYDAPVAATALATSPDMRAVLRPDGTPLLLPNGTAVAVNTTALLAAAATRLAGPGLPAVAAAVTARGTAEGAVVVTLTVETPAASFAAVAAAAAGLRGVRVSRSPSGSLVLSVVVPADVVAGNDTVASTATAQMHNEVPNSTRAAAEDGSTLDGSGTVTTQKARIKPMPGGGRGGGRAILQSVESTLTTVQQRLARAATAAARRGRNPTAGQLLVAPTPVEGSLLPTRGNTSTADGPANTSVTPEASGSQEGPVPTLPEPTPGGANFTLPATADGTIDIAPQDNAGAAGAPAGEQPVAVWPSSGTHSGIKRPVAVPRHTGPHGGRTAPTGRSRRTRAGPRLVRANASNNGADDSA